MTTAYVTAAAAVLVPLIEIVRGDNDRDVFDPTELDALAKSDRAAPVGRQPGPL
jgi:hypothetical protein